MNKKTRIVHISHTDLDGYGCHLVSAMSHKGLINFHNIDYGDFLECLKNITVFPEDMVLITDLNLNAEEAKAIDDMQKKYGFELQLLDHHGTGRPQAEKYDWYHLDTTKSGTLLTWEFFNSPEKLEGFAHTVNAYDLWKEEHPLFNKGKLLERVISDNKRTFPEELQREEREHILATLMNVQNLLDTGVSVAEADFKRYAIARKLFLEGGEDPLELTLHEVKVRFFTDKIMAQKPYEIVKIDGFNVYVFTGLSRIFQIFSNKILNENDDIDIAININQYGYMSIRSRRKDLDLGEISAFYFGGGGHPQAAGGNLGLEKGTKIESSQELKDIFKNIIENKRRK